MGGRDAREGNIICEIVNSVGQGNFTFVREESRKVRNIWRRFLRRREEFRGRAYVRGEKKAFSPLYPCTLVQVGTKFSPGIIERAKYESLLKNSHLRVRWNAKGRGKFRISTRSRILLSLPFSRVAIFITTSVLKKIRSLFYPQSKWQSTCSLEILPKHPLPLKTALKSWLLSLFEDFSWCYFTQDTQKVFRIPLAVQQAELVLWDLRFTMVCGPMMAGKSVLQSLSAGSARMLLAPVSVVNYWTTLYFNT